MSPAPNLRLLYPRTTNVDSIIITIPDAGGSAPEDWKHAQQQPWLKELQRRTCPNSLFFSFEYAFSVDNAFTWPDLVSKADTLLDRILVARRDYKAQECPIVMICAGLGGIILKQAFNIMAKHFMEFQDLLLVMSAAVFISTPHLAANTEALTKRILSIPKLRPKAIIHKGAIKGEGLDKVVSCCQAFDQLHFQEPVLTIYEVEKTAIPGMFNRQIEVVGKELSSIGTSDETVVASSKDYLSVCDIDSNGSIFSTISIFIQEKTSAASWNIMVTLSRRSSASAAEDITIRTPSIAPEDTNAATAGSSTADFVVIPDIQDFSVAKRLPVLPCYMYESRDWNHDFWGRADILERLSDALIPSLTPESSVVRGIRSLALSGLGGLGKTEIATKFMLTYRKEFDAIFWIQADEKTKLEEGFASITIALGLEDAETAKDQTASTDLAKAWLAKPLKDPNADETDPANIAKWLLILDNVDDPECLNDFWPQFGTGSILITSRNPLVKNTFYAVSIGLDLSPFEPKEAADFLLSLTHKGEVVSSTLANHALTLVNILGGHTLGIKQAAGIIRERDCSLDEFRLELEQQQGSNETVSSTLHRDVRGFITTIDSMLALAKLSKDSQSLLDIASILDPDSINEAILIGATASNLQLDGFPRDVEAYEKARNELYARSIISRNKEVKVLRIHRLTQYTARSRMSEHYFHNVLAFVTHLISTAWPHAPSQDARHSIALWSQREALLPHVIQIYAQYKRLHFQIYDTSSGRKAADLFSDAAWYLLERGIGTMFDELLSAAEALCQGLPEDRDRILSDIFYARGGDAAETNRKEIALKNNLALLAMRLRMYENAKQQGREPDDLGLAHAYNQAANARLDQGEIAVAIQLYETALKIHREHRDYNETKTSMIIANYGSALWLAGRLEEAHQHVLDNLLARHKAFGVDDKHSFRTGRLLHVLGNICASQGRLSQSFNYHRRALDQYRATVGNTHHRTADLCVKVADHSLRLAKIADAELLLMQAQKIFQQRPFFRNELARCHWLSARLYSLKGNPEQQQVHLREAFDLYRLLDPYESREDEELTGKDFDDLVCFASR